MGYIALYRKYRPDKFKDIVGQDNITLILKNQIKNLKISHAYIFSGTRGTGKTTAAKIFARAINCTNGHEGEPCNECEACRSIIDGDTTDVVEMDAASNNSVENIRQIRSEVVYASTSVKYRVYIIDEVHMLTTSAFNALLKTLEEPPENVVFILATTEQHKIPITILSRCLRFEFSKISEENIKARILHVLNEEDVKYEEEAVEYIAKLADGALRDALSILDRCLSEKEEVLRLAKVEEIIGATSKEILDKLVDSILNRDNLAVVSAIDEVVLKGKDLRQLVYSLTERFLELLVKSNSKDYIDKIANIIDELSSLDNDIRLSSKPTILIKSALVRISNLGNKKIAETESNNDIDSNPRIEKLENEVNKLTNIINTIKKDGITENKSANQANYESKIVNEEKSINNENMKPFKDYEKFKNTILSKGKIKAYSTLAGSNMYLTDENAIIITKNEYSYKIISADEQKETISKMLNEEYGITKPLIIKLKKQVNETRFEKLLKDSNTEYTKLD